MTDPRLDKALRILRDFVRAAQVRSVGRPRVLDVDEEWALRVLVEHMEGS